MMDGSIPKLPLRWSGLRGATLCPTNAFLLGCGVA